MVYPTSAAPQNYLQTLPQSQDKMTAEQFCYWLQGYFELKYDVENSILTPQQVQIIKDHLKLVFNKATPVYPSTQTWTSCQVGQHLNDVLDITGQSC